MANAEKRTDIFEKMPVRQAVITQIVPAIASQMIALIYNLADMYFVGMLNDPRQTAALSIVSSPFVMITAISNLFGIGGASLIAQHLGRKDEERANQAATISIIGGILSACLFSMLFFLFANPILHLCGATDSTYHIAFEYAKWVLIIGGPASIINMLLANMVRAEGSSVHASIGVSLGGVINLLLDPLFVLPAFLGLGAAGAGIATAISNYMGTAYFLTCLIRKRHTTVITVRPGNLKYTNRHLKGILSIGFPSAVQFTLTVVAVAAQLNFVSNYETEAVAAIGIVRKLDQLPLYFSIGVANGLLPLLAYNHAAGAHKRRQDIFQFGAMISLGFSLLCVLIYESFAPVLTGLFIEDALTKAYGAAFLRIMVLAMPMMSLAYPMIVQFQALGCVRESLVCSILRKGVVDIPLLFLLDTFIPLYGCMMVQPIVDTLSLIVALIFCRRINQKNSAGT